MTKQQIYTLMLRLRTIREKIAHGIFRLALRFPTGCRHKNKRARGFLLELSKVAATYSPTTQCSTIGDAELNDPVRNGKGWDLSAITT